MNSLSFPVAFCWLAYLQQIKKFWESSLSASAFLQSSSLDGPCDGWRDTERVMSAEREVKVEGNFSQVL